MLIFPKDFLLQMEVTSGRLLSELQVFLSLFYFFFQYHVIKKIMGFLVFLSYTKNWRFHPICKSTPVLLMPSQPWFLILDQTKMSILNWGSSSIPWSKVTDILSGVEPDYQAMGVNCIKSPCWVWESILEYP